MSRLAIYKVKYVSKQTIKLGVKDREELTAAKFYNIYNEWHIMT